MTQYRLIVACCLSASNDYMCDIGLDLLVSEKIAREVAFPALVALSKNLIEAADMDDFKLRTNEHPWDDSYANDPAFLLYAMFGDLQSDAADDANAVPLVRLLLEPRVPPTEAEDASLTKLVGFLSQAGGSVPSVLTDAAEAANEVVFDDDAPKAQRAFLDRLIRDQLGLCCEALKISPSDAYPNNN